MDKATSQGARLVPSASLIGRLFRLFTDPAKLTVVAGWTGRLVTAAAQFISIRLITQTLGLDTYGAFAVITGFLVWFMLADLGFGAALQNHISQSRADGAGWQAAVRSVAGLLAGTTLVLSVLVLAVSPWAGPYFLSVYGTISSAEATASFAAFGILTLLAGALSIMLKVQFAEHRGYVAHAVTGGGAAAGLLCLALVMACHPQNGLLYAIIAYHFPLVLLSAGLLIRFLTSQKGQARSATRLLPPLWKKARSFLLFAALSAVVLNLDYAILARTVSPAEVVGYAIINKAFLLIFIMYNSVLQAYWPLSAEAMHRGDTLAVKTLIRRCLVAGLAIVSVGTLGFLATSRLVATLLSPHEPPALPTTLILAYGLYWLLRVWTDVFAILIMSAGRVDYLCRIVPIQALVSVPLAYFGALHFGVLGMLGGMVIGYVCTVAWMMPRYLMRHLVNLEA